MVENESGARECDTKLLREIIGRGLVAGLGNNEKTCIEGAISLACGGDLSDLPPCVAGEDRGFAIGINDSAWSSPQARAEALLPLALAQIGTDGKDRTEWVRLLVEGTVRRVVPLALRAAAEVHHDERHRIALRAAAERCAGVRLGGTVADAAAPSADVAARAAADAGDAYVAAAEAYNAAAAEAGVHSIDVVGYAARAAARAAANAARAAAARANAAVCAVSYISLTARTATFDPNASYAARSAADAVAASADAAKYAARAASVEAFAAVDDAIRKYAAHEANVQASATVDSITRAATLARAAAAARDAAADVGFARATGFARAMVSSDTYAADYVARAAARALDDEHHIASAAADASDAVLRESVAVALDAYAATRHLLEERRSGE